MKMSFLNMLNSYFDILIKVVTKGVNLQILRLTIFRVYICIKEINLLFIDQGII